MKTIMKKMSKYLLIYWAGVLIALVALILLQYPILFAFELSDIAKELVFFAVQIIASTAWIFVGAYRKGLKNKEFRLKDVLIPMLLAFAVVQVAAPIFQYVVYIAGPTMWMSRGIQMITTGDMVIEKVPYWLSHLCMLCYDILLYIPAILLGEYFGTKKSIKMREELLANSKL